MTGRRLPDNPTIAINRSMFARYNIVRDDDVRSALETCEACTKDSSPRNPR